MKKESKKLIEAIKYKNEHPEISCTKIGEKFRVNRKSISKGIKEVEKYTIESPLTLNIYIIFQNKN